jgi:hypothetical protein
MPTPDSSNCWRLRACLGRAGGRAFVVALSAASVFQTVLPENPLRPHLGFSRIFSSNLPPLQANRLIFFVIHLLGFPH